MAASLWCDVRQTTPSTPAVRLPRLLTTRRTANALADHEWVRSHCKAFTLPQRPSRVAFAIRICSRRTCFCAACQSMASHVAGVEEAPIDGFVIVVICFSSCWRFYKLSCDERPVGRGLTFVPGDVQTRIHTITAWHSLLPTSQAGTPIGSSCDSLSLAGGVPGFHVPLKKYAGLGACCRPGDLLATKA